MHSNVAVFLPSNNGFFGNFAKKIGGCVKDTVFYRQAKKAVLPIS